MIHTTALTVELKLVLVFLIYSFIRQHVQYWTNYFITLRVKCNQKSYN